MFSIIMLCVKDDQGDLCNNNYRYTHMDNFAGLNMHVFCLIKARKLHIYFIIILAVTVSKFM